MTSRVLPLLLIALILAPIWAGAVPAADDPLPLDPQVRIGRLENGLTYYIRANHKPENLAEIRLAVNAGSLLEEDDQQGLAHFLEHMAFNGTEHFAGNDLISFLESIGSRFGPDINAYTSMDETVYLLEIPTDKEGLLDRGLMVLGDWAGGMTIAPEDVEKERGVIMEEWRLGRGARERVRTVQWPVLYRDSRYAERLPIGLPEIVETAPAQRLRDFYETWYQPQLMAVVAVGDFEPDSVEAMIRTRFADLPAPAAPSVRPEFDVPPHVETLVSVAGDEELSTTQVSVTFKHPRGGQGRLADYRRGLVDGLFSDLLNARFAEIGELPDAPFLFAGSGAGSSVRSLDMFRAFAVTAEGGAERGLESLLTEIERVRAHGFGQGEFDRGTARYRASLERAYQERDKTESASYAGEYVSNFLDQEPIPGIDYEYETGLALLDDIELGEVNSSIDRLVHEDNMVILVSGPKKDDAPLPTDEALLAEVLRARGSRPPAYVDSLAAAGLLSREPEPGTVTGRSEREDLGVTVLTLSNGMEVWLKPTNFKNDQILFASQLPGGTSLVDSTLYPSASLATAYVGEAGYGGWTPTDLRKLLAGKLAGASATISDFDQRVGGSSTPADLETALQLLYLVLTDPLDRREAFTILTDRYRSFIENRLASPEARYGDAARALNSRDHYMFRSPTVDWLDRADPETALDFYRARMSEFRGCRWYFVGAFDPAEIEPLLLRYIGALPAPEGSRPQTRDVELRFPEGVLEHTVRAGTEPKARVLISWPAITGLEEMEVFRLRMAGDILDIRLRDILREDLGGTYSVQVGLSVYYTYPQYGTSTVSFGCAPENVESLTTRVFEEVERFKRDGPELEEVERIQEQERRSLEKGLETNGYWLSSLLTLDILGWDPGRILAREERIDSLTPEILQETFARYYPSDNHTTVTLLPESE